MHGCGHALSSRLAAEDNASSLLWPLRARASQRKGMFSQLSMSEAKLLGWQVLALWQTSVFLLHKSPQLKLRRQA